MIPQKTLTIKTKHQCQISPNLRRTNTYNSEESTNCSNSTESHDCVIYHIIYKMLYFYIFYVMLIKAHTNNLKFYSL